MTKRVSLRAYVRRRNGVGLGAPGSMGNMLRRSFGAPTLAGFWRHWNPIWSYGLGRFVQAPLRRRVPAPVATVLTFGASGLIHDAVIMALRGEFTLLFTPWFLLVAGAVLISERFGWSFAGLETVVRARVHAAVLAGSFGLAMCSMVMLRFY